MKPFVSIPQAISDLGKGKMLIVVDNPNRENQGDVIFPAYSATAQKVNFLLSECRGMVCVPITEAKAIQLSLPLMVEPVHNSERTRVNFTDSVDAVSVADFGISASDRSLTIQTIAKGETKPSDLVRPGHVFPLLAQNGGLLERPGHTEATITLMQLSGSPPVGVLSEILNPDGTIARLADLVLFSRKHKISLVSIADLVRYLKRHPLQKTAHSSLTRESSARLPTIYGTFDITIYRSLFDTREHAILTLGKLKEPVLTRIHSQCLTGDTFLSLRCDCREQLHKSMQLISQHGSGIILYLNQEGRGIGLSNKIKAYALQEKGLDTVEANHALGFPGDSRDYGIVSEILHDFHISEISLLTNNPDKKKQLAASGIRVIDRIPLEVSPNALNKHYLFVKKQKLGHYLTAV